MTFLEIQDQVLQLLEESTTTPVFHLRPFVREAVNNGLRSLAEFTEFYKQRHTLDVEAGKLTYEMHLLDDNNGILMIDRARNHATNVWMEHKTPEKLDTEWAQWSNMQGQPAWLVPRGFNAVQFVPQASENSPEGIELEVSELPPDLQGDGEEPAFPRQFHRALVFYACYELRLQEKDVAGALDDYSNYLMERARYRDYLMHADAQRHRMGGE